MTSDSAAALAAVSAWGAFFQVRTHRPRARPTPPMSTMGDWLRDPRCPARRIDAVRRALTERAGVDTPPHVAASVTQQGIAARLVSPWLGLAVHSGRFLAYRSDDVWWQPDLGGGFPLSVTGATTDAPGDLLVDLAPLVELTARYRVGRRVLWGNVASAINGAAAVLGATRPELAERAAAVANTVLDLGPLRDAGLRVDGRFRRRSCCLIYRANPAGRAAVCGDCVLTSFEPGT